MAEESKSRLLARAMKDFRPTPEGDRNVKRHAVHDRTSFFRSSPSASLYNDSKINRQTAAPQIDDMVRSGQVRAKEFKVKGGNRDTVYWTKGAALPGKESAAYGQTKYIIEANANVADLKRPLSLNEVTIRNQTKPGVWQDITDQVRSAHQAYKKQLANVPQRAANAARGDAAFAGPPSAKQFLDDSVAYGSMGTVGSGLPSRIGPIRPTAY